MNTRHDHPGQTRWTNDLAEKGARLIISAFPQATLNPHLARIAARCVMDLVDNDDHDMEGGVTADAIEKDLESHPLSGVGLAGHFREQRDAAKNQAEQAQQERDAAREEAATLWGRLRDTERALDGWLARAEKAERALAETHLAEQPRPLTADDITDEMVERARRAYDGGQDHIGILVAALKEPLARPEGAEELEIVIGLNAGDWTEGPESVRALADLLASHGVRVTGDQA